jgi:hypothetical protein
LQIDSLSVREEHICSVQTKIKNQLILNLNGN